MNNDIQQTQREEPNPLPFGHRLKSAREAMGLDHKDIAAQLRLNETILGMLEKDHYPSDLPVTFIRGYIRAYGKLLQIPENEIKKAIEPLKPKPQADNPPPLKMTSTSVTSSDFFMQISTYLIIFIILALAGMWWYSRVNQPTTTTSLALSDTTQLAENTIATSTPNPAVVTGSGTPPVAPTTTQPPVGTQPPTPTDAKPIDPATPAATTTPASAPENVQPEPKAHKKTVPVEDIDEAQADQDAAAKAHAKAPQKADDNEDISSDHNKQNNTNDADNDGDGI
jgi:cytoskeleton protein RodZ